MNKLEFEIPFMGFYMSNIEDDYDNEVEEAGIEYGVINWKATKLNTAKAWASQASQQCGIDFEFVEVISPRFYNYSTDRIVVQLPEADLLRVKEQLEVDDDFKEFIEETCKSRDGFISHLDSDLSKWTEWSYLEYTKAFHFLLRDEEDQIYGVVRGNGGMSLFYLEDKQ